MSLLLVNGENLGMGIEPCATRTHYPVHRPRKRGGEGAGTAKPTYCLTRKMDPSWAGGSTRRRVAEPGEGGGVGQVAGCCGGVGVGRGGEAGERDLEAEGAELADVVSDLAAGAGVLVVVRAEVFISRAGAG